MILLAVTIVWTLAWRQHVIAYKQMIKESEERFQKWLEEHKESGIVDMLGLQIPFWAYRYGPFLAISGFIIGFAWAVSLNEAFEEWRKDKGAKNKRVSPVVVGLEKLATATIFVLFCLIVLYAPLIF